MSDQLEALAQKFEDIELRYHAICKHCNPITTYWAVYLINVDDNGIHSELECIGQGETPLEAVNDAYANYYESEN